MYPYNAIQWLFIFYFYCFFGWCFESAYVSLKSRKLVNRGFMRGPFLPLYGSGAIMMLLVSAPFQDSMVLVYIAGCLGATVLEYVTGVTMEALFKVRYWDYSKQPLNFQGHICLGSSLAWGGLTILMTEVIHKPVEKFVLSINQHVLTVCTLLLTVYIAADFALSFKAALDLRDVLVKMEKAKEDMARIHKRLDVLIAVAGEDIEQKREAFAESMEQRKENFAEGALMQHMDEMKDSIEDRLKGMSHIIKGNPTISSSKYKEALDELKKKIETRKSKTEK